MKKINFISVFLLVLTMLIVFLSKANSQEVVNVEVNNIKIKSITPAHNFVGANWVITSQGFKDIFSDTEKLDQFANAIKKSNIDTIRYPSGVNIMNFFWDISPLETYKAMKKLDYVRNNSGIYNYFNSLGNSNNLDFFSFLEFCRKNGFKATVQVNSFKVYDKDSNSIKIIKPFKAFKQTNTNWDEGKVDWNLVRKAAMSAAEEVKWVKENGYNDVVKYWEIGNEEYLKNSEAHAAYTGEEYGKIASLFVHEMKKADTSAKIIVTNMPVLQNPDLAEKPVFINHSYFYKWTNAVLNNLKEENNNLFAVSSHIYPLLSTKITSIQSYKAKLLENPHYDINKKYNFHKTVLNKYGFGNTFIFLNEFNSNNPDSIYSQNWISTFGNAKMILSCANNPYCYHCDYHELLDGYDPNDDVYTNKGWGILHYAKDMTSSFYLYPIANIISLLNENIKGNILKTNVSNIKIDAAGSCDNGVIRVILSNMGQDRLVNLKLKGFNNIKYVRNESLGINIPETFSIIKSGDSRSYPSEIGQINTLDNAVKINYSSGIYKINIPANTLSVFIFKKDI